MKAGVQLYLICPCVVLTKWSAWHSQQICLCCELLGEVRKRATFLSSFQKKYYPPLSRIHFRNLRFFAAGFGSWCNLQWSRKVSDQPDMCSPGACEPWQHDRRKICCNVVTMLNVELWRLLCSRFPSWEEDRMEQKKGKSNSIWLLCWLLQKREGTHYISISTFSIP